jgi:cyclic pyranopterin phosphate synthase
VLTVAQIAGILGAKKTSDLIPLCHPIALNQVEVGLSLPTICLAQIKGRRRTTGKTG